MTKATIIPPLTNNPPSRANPSAFPTDGDSFLNDLPDVVSGVNTAATELNTWNAEVETFKNQASSSQTNAANSSTTSLTQARNAAASMVSLWVSGTTYPAGQIVYSNVDGREYKRITAGAGTTDPSSDTANWEPLGWEYITNYPDIRPTLDLNFAGSQTVDPRITFTRNSIATYFDKFGVMQTAEVNQPRIDFDPVTGECKGLLIEEQRTNLLTYSGQFDNASWTKQNCTISSNSIVAPDGTLTGDAMTADGTSNPHTILQGASANASGRTISVYAKAGTATFLQVLTAGSTNPVANFDLVNGTSNMIGSNSTASITPVGNGWYRCVLASSDTAATDVYFAIVTSLTSGRISSNTSSGTLYLWGAQLEQGSFPTSYIPTTSSAVTRQADNASMTGSNFTSWYRQDEGTIYCENSRKYEHASIGYAITDGTLTNLTQLLLNPTDTRFTVTAGGANNVNLISSSTHPQALRSAFAVKSNDFARALNNQPLLTSASIAAPVASRMDIGSRLGLYQLNGHIKKLTYYPKRLPNATLQAIAQP